MTNPVLEQAARAVLSAQRSGRDFRLNPPYNQELPLAASIARAVIESLREPSREMLEAGFYAGLWTDSIRMEGPDDGIEAAADVFKAMIDAALAEG